jgi:hypothetical protein
LLPAFFFPPSRLLGLDVDCSPTAQAKVTHAGTQSVSFPQAARDLKTLAELTTNLRIKRSLAKARLDIDEAFVEVVRRSRAILKASKSLAGRASIKCAAAICLAFRQCKVVVGAKPFADVVGASEGNLRNVMAAMAKR